MWANDVMVTLLGGLRDTPESYKPTKFEADRPNGLGVIANRNFLKGPSKAHALSLLDPETGSFKQK